MSYGVIIPDKKFLGCQKLQREKRQTTVRDSFQVIYRTLNEYYDVGPSVRSYSSPTRFN